MKCIRFYSLIIVKELQKKKNKQTNKQKLQKRINFIDFSRGNF